MQLPSSPFFRIRKPHGTKRCVGLAMLMFVQMYERVLNNYQHYFFFGGGSYN